MRAMVELSARRAYAYDNTYNRHLQARLYEEFDEGRYVDLHERQKPGLYSYTGPFPERDAEEGDRRRLMFAAHDPHLITEAVHGLCTTPTLNIGEMPLSVEEAFMLDPRVGERGELTTGTPIIVRFGTEVADEYDIETQYDQTFWRPHHGVDLFFEQLNRNLQWKYRLAFDDEPPAPPYFTEYSLERTVAKPLEYDGHQVPHIGHQWTFAYEIETATHRRLLNLALDTGLGQLNGVGFGFINKAEDVNDGVDGQ